MAGSPPTGNGTSLIWLVDADCLIFRHKRTFADKSPFEVQLEKIENQYGARMVKVLRIEFQRYETAIRQQFFSEQADEIISRDMSGQDRIQVLDLMEGSELANGVDSFIREARSLNTKIDAYMDTNANKATLLNVALSATARFPILTGSDTRYEPLLSLLQNRHPIQVVNFLKEIPVGSLNF